MLIDKLREECGVFGIYAPGKDVARLSYYALYALQHRGQESAGIAVADGHLITLYKNMGLVSEVFPNPNSLHGLKGDLAIGHVRYSTSGESSLENAQPLLVKYRRGSIAISHNGNLVNGVKLRQSLEDKGSIFQTTTDSELIAHLIAREQDADIEEAITRAMPHLRGAYAFVIMTETSLIGLRDYYGIRPLSLGKMEGGGYVLASETCAFDTIGAEFIRDIQSGEMVVIDRGGIRSRTVAAETGKAICIFEYIYFARPDSNIEEKNVHLVRKELGRQVAREHPIEADIVIGVPDSSIAAASGLAEELGLPYEVGFIKNRYIGRTFIQPDQKARDLGVKLKLNPVKKIVAGRRVLMVDDSIVRGTTCMRIVQMLKNAGAREVHVRITSPPVKHSCYYGIDTSVSEELIANRMAVSEMSRAIGADSLEFLSVEGMLSAVGFSLDEACLACFDGHYLVKPEVS